MAQNHNKLTPKQKNFCLEYLKDFNACRAYKETYWVTQESAESASIRLLGNVKVAKYIARKTIEKFDKLEISVEWILETIKEVIQRSLQQTPVMVFDKVEKEYVQKEEEVQDEEWNWRMVWVYEYDSRWALKWLEMLGKYMKMFTMKHEHSWPDWDPIEFADLSWMSKKDKELLRQKLIAGTTDDDE